MLQYLIILLDDTSISFCHYKNPKTERRLIPLETLRQGIRFGMLENLMIQYVYPDYELPQEYQEVIESIDHSKIKPINDGADVLVTNKLESVSSDVPVVLRIGKEWLFTHEAEISDALGKVSRLNIVLSDVETFSEDDFTHYKTFLERLSISIEQQYVEGKIPQLNIMTDRMMLSQMNNCGAGDISITLAPNGRFYVCPAFYYEDEMGNVGNLECKRCIWLNKKLTLEVNTPSHEQCVLAHLERNSSRLLLQNMRKHGEFLPDQEEIKEIDYLDPFDKRDEWQ